MSVVISPKVSKDLYEAARVGDILEIRRLLQDLTFREARRVLEHSSIVVEPVLNIAVHFKHENVVRDLVEYFGVTVDAKSDEESSPLMQSVLGGNVGILRIISKKLKYPDRGYPIHRVCGGETPNGIQVLKILIHSGANINLKNHKGLTPLMIVCQKRNSQAQDMVKILLQGGAMVNISSPDGNTALHFAIQQTDEMLKELAWDRLNVLKWLVKAGAKLKPNNLGLKPLHLACLKGNAETLTFLSNSFSVDDAELADYHELLASSLYFNKIKRDGKFSIICKINETHCKAFKHLEIGMKLRTSHETPLWKFTNQIREEGLLYHVETQTFEELHALKNHGEGLLVELILARQRVLPSKAYEDHLMPLIIEYYLYLKNKHHYSQAISLLTHKMRLQLQLTQRKFEHTIIFLLGLFRSYRHSSQWARKDDQKIAEAVITFIEECYESEPSEKRFLLRWLYLTQMHLLYLCLCNPSIGSSDIENIRGLTKRFLSVTRAIKKSVLATYDHCEDAYLFGSCTSEPFRAVVGDNSLHVACRHIPKDESNSNDDRNCTCSFDHPTRLSALLEILHSCGEDINAINSEGKTPLKVLLDRHSTAMTVECRLAVQTLLIEGADPDVKDKLEQTALNSVLVGYLSPSCDITCYIELKTVLILLLKSGADPNAQDKRGYTLLHHLMEIYNQGVVQGIQSSHQTAGDNNGFSFQEFVEILQSFGGSADLFTQNGRSALDMCKDEAVESQMRLRLLDAKRNWMTLARIAGRTIRLQKVPYRQVAPTTLVHVIELKT
nr:uncharacterized protein LOC129277885 [Lytechinus pictus]